MKLIKPSYSILDQGPGIKGIYEAIERAGRTCYKSIRPEGQTAKDFVDRMIASQHYAMLEHGTVYLKLSKNNYVKDFFFVNFFENNKYSVVNLIDDNYYITTNLRVIIEGPDYISNNWKSYAVFPTEYHEKRVTVRFTTDRGVSHEFVRHRVFSFAQESTRYCNYSKDKFGNELTFIIPSWVEESRELASAANVSAHRIKDMLYNETYVDYEMFSPETKFLAGLTIAENIYLNLINCKGWTPQQARQILPNALKTELVMTGFVSDWEHFFDLRAKGTTGAPHPDAKALAEPLMNEFINRGLI